MRKRFVKAIHRWKQQWLRRSEEEKLAVTIQYLAVLEMAARILRKLFS
jgi:hypothetical protein